MTDEPTWERRWIKAIQTIAEHEEVIEDLRHRLQDAEERAYKAESNRDDWKERAKELKAQVERLIAKEGERIGAALVTQREPAQ